MPDVKIIRIAPDEVLGNISPYLTGACIEDVNHEIYGGIFDQMIFGESFEEAPMLIDERLNPAFAGLSGTLSCSMERTYLKDRDEVCSWQPFRRGTAEGEYKATVLHARRGHQSQKITFARGEGEVGIENQGLNRWGLNLVGGKPYEGTLVVCAEDRVSVKVALESEDGACVYAETILSVSGDKVWNILTFTLTPAASDTHGRFAIILGQPGSVWIDYVLLQPGRWGRFNDLPVRKDIGQGLVDEGLTVLRFGGYMVNTDWEHEKRSPGSGYRWKKGLGPRPDRPPYLGTFYPHNTSGFSIPDFVSFCEAAGFLCIPTVNPSEKPEDVADLVEYLNGGIDTVWGARRVADGHPQPFGLRYLQIGNEEWHLLPNGERWVRTDYPELLGPILKAVSQRDPSVTIIVAPWLYYEKELNWPKNREIVKRLMDVLHGHTVLWDVHVGGDELLEGNRLERFFPLLRAYINEIDPENQVIFCILEENGQRHDLQRALGHAHIINTIERMAGEVVIDCAANCLQAYLQNDNCWDQGQLFYTPQQVWGMPPYTAQQMIREHYQPLLIRTVTDAAEDLDVTVTRSQEGDTVVVKVVNLKAVDQPTRIEFESDFEGKNVTIHWLTDSLDARNTPQEPHKVTAKKSEISWGSEGCEYTIPAYSFTILEFKKE
jgi:alpha-L-arabinofuranosidase